MLEVISFLLAPFAACFIMVIIYGYFGIHVIKREIIFIDIALAQIAAVGATLAMIFWHAEEHGLTAYAMAFGCTVLGAGFYAMVGQRIKQIPHEAVIGVSYAVAAAGALFILALAAGGDVHLEHMLTGSILWAGWSDIILCGIVFGMTGLFHLVFRKRFMSLSDMMESSDHHERSVLWDFLFYVTMGLVITLSVHIAGVLVIFSLLIIPAAFSALFADSWKKRIIIAWGMGLSATILGLVFSYVLDFSCGPAVVSFLGIILIAGALLQKVRSPA